VLVIDRWPSHRPGVVTLVGEGVAAGVAQHVGGRLDLQIGAGRRPLDHPGKAGCRKWRPALADEDEGRRRTLALQSAEGPQLVALDRVRVRRSVLSNQSAIPGSGGSMPSAVAKALR
jgi:hypothetical protein